MSQNNSTYEDNINRIYLYYKWDHHITKEKRNKLYVLNKKDIDTWKSAIKYEELKKELKLKKEGKQIHKKDISEFYKNKKNDINFSLKINNISLINDINTCKRKNGHYINPKFFEGKEIELVNKEVNDSFKIFGMNAEIEVDYIEKDGKYILAYLDNDEKKKINNENEKDNKKQNETNKSNEIQRIKDNKNIKNEEKKRNKLY